MTGSIDLRVDDAERAGDVGSRLFYPQQLTVLGGNAPFAMTLHGGPLGAVFIGENAFSRDVRIDCGELLTSYHVNLPLTGRLTSVHRGTKVEASPDLAAVYGPQGDTVLARWEAGCRQLCIKIDRNAMELALSARLGRDLIGADPELDPALDVTRGQGESWARLVRALHLQLRRPGAVAYSPMVAVPLAEAVVQGLLDAASRRVRAAEADPAGPATHPAIRRAIEYVHDYVGEPITTADLALHCGLSVRAVQEGFARDVGQPPLSYVRTVRLRHAHRELLAADPHVTTVASIANRWGFPHLGRFAASHLDAFGEPPAVTLRRTPA